MTRPAQPLDVPFHRPFLGDSETGEVTAVLRRNHLAGGGPIGERVERDLSRILGCTHVSLLPSCTHALELAIRALGVGAGDEMILPSFAHPADANAVHLAGARVVFADVLADSMSIDPDDVLRKVSARTRGVIVVHYGGNACPMEEILQISKERQIVLIEDAAHAVGASWRGRALGTLGQIGCFSFHETKNIQCGEGGALVTSDDDVAAVIAVQRESGTDRARFLAGEVEAYRWISTGTKGFPSELQAAVLGAQLARLDEVTRRHRELARLYSDALAELDEEGLLELGKTTPGADSNHHVFYLHVKDLSQRKRVIERAATEGVDLRFHYSPLHSSPFAKTTLGWTEPLPVTEHRATTIVRLPIYFGLSDEQAHRVCEVVVRSVREVSGARQR